VHNVEFACADDCNEDQDCWCNCMSSCECMKDVGGSSTAFIDDAWDGVVPEPCSMSYSYSYFDAFDCIFDQYSSCCEMFEAVADGDMTCATWAVDIVAYEECWAGDLTDQCYISQCGCPSVDFLFGEDWCTEDNAIINSDWCSESEDNCERCNGELCKHDPMNFYSYEYQLDYEFMVPYEFGSHSHRALEGSDTKKVLTGHISGVPLKELFAKHMTKAMATPEGRDMVNSRIESAKADAKKRETAGEPSKASRIAKAFAERKEATPSKAKVKASKAAEAKASRAWNVKEVKKEDAKKA